MDWWMHRYEVENRNVLKLGKVWLNQLTIHLFIIVIAFKKKVIKESYPLDLDTFYLNDGLCIF